MKMRAAMIYQNVRIHSASYTAPYLKILVFLATLLWQLQIWFCFFQVFSEPYSPLKNLVKASCNVHLAKDLEQLVSVLDLHVDRMMQIGMFAMACSGDEGRMCVFSICTLWNLTWWLLTYKFFFYVYISDVLFYRIHNIYIKGSHKAMSHASGSPIVIPVHLTSIIFMFLFSRT